MFRGNYRSIAMKKSILSIVLITTIIVASFGMSACSAKSESDKEPTIKTELQTSQPESEAKETAVAVVPTIDDVEIPDIDVEDLEDSENYPELFIDDEYLDDVDVVVAAAPEPGADSDMFNVSVLNNGMVVIAAIVGYSKDNVTHYLFERGITLKEMHNFWVPKDIDNVFMRIYVMDLFFSYKGLRLGDRYYNDLDYYVDITEHPEGFKRLVVSGALGGMLVNDEEVEITNMSWPKTITSNLLID